MYRHFLLSLFSTVFLTIYVAQGQDFKSLDFASLEMPPEHLALISKMPDSVQESLSYAYEYKKLKNIMVQLVEKSNKIFPVVISDKVPFVSAQTRGLIILHHSILEEHESIQAYILSHVWGHALEKHADDYQMSPDSTTWEYHKMPSDTEVDADTFAAKFLLKNGYGINKIQSFLKKTPHAHTYAVLYIQVDLFKTIRKGQIQKQYSATSYRSKCPHLIHPSGDFNPCKHREHSQDGLPPNLRPCVHPQHSEGDRVNCTHYQHPNNSCVVR